jgi:hypothetical protein
MRDLKVEQYLEDEGYDFEYVEDMAFDRITLDLNRARWEEQVEEDRVVSIGIAVEQGKKMPAIVVAVTASSLYALLSGRHRMEGSQLCGKLTCAAYLITSVLDNFELEFQPYALNNMEGRSPSKDSKLKQTAYFLKRHPERDKKAICLKMGLKVSAIDQYLKLELVQDRAMELNVVTDIAKVHPDIRIYANESLKLNAVFKGAVQCMAFVGMTKLVARSFIKTLMNAPKEAIALEMIRNEVTKHEETIKRIKRQNRRGRLLPPETKFYYAVKNTNKKWPEHLDMAGLDEDDLKASIEHMKDMRGYTNEWIDKAAEALQTHERRRQQESGKTTPDGEPLFDPG